MTNKETFQQTLEAEYRELFAQHADYKQAAKMTTPTLLAQKMTTALANGTGNKDGHGVKNTCKKLNIPYTYKGISEYLGNKPSNTDFFDTL